MTTSRKTLSAADLNTETFGIEIELHGLTQTGAARVLSNAFGTAWMGRHQAFDTAGRKWNCVYDGSLTNGGCEVVSPVLRYEDMDLLQTVVRALRAAGAYVSSQTGIHVHVGAANLTVSNLVNLTTLVYRREELITAACGVSSRRIDSWCRPTSKRTVDAIRKGRKGASHLQDLKGAFYIDAMGCSSNQDRSHYSGTRYFGLNLHSIFYGANARGADGSTVEFRWFDGTLHAGKIKSYVQLVLALVLKARRSKAIQAKKSARGITGAAMGEFMSRLGMKGPEFETARLHLVTRAFQAPVAAAA